PLPIYAVFERALHADAQLAGNVAVFALDRRVRVREVVELFLRALVAQAGQQVRVPAAAFGDEVVARIERDAVLAVVQVVVVGEVRVLVVQLAVDRPVRGDELADADGAERRIVGETVTILEVVADAAGEVPAIVELLRIGGLHAADAGEQRGTEEFLVHQGSAPLIGGVTFSWLSLAQTAAGNAR